jgi:hypothetical protein
MQCTDEEFLLYEAVLEYGEDKGAPLTSHGRGQLFRQQMRYRYAKLEGTAGDFFTPAHPLYQVIQWLRMWIAEEAEEENSSSCTQSPRVEVPCC